MTTFMREVRILRIFTAMAIFLAASAGTTLAQHLISSRAGFVNRTDGKVYVTRFGSVDEERGRASLGTQMRNGDLLTTEPGAFAEVLLNPGTYLRLNQKSSVRAINTSLTSVQFEVVSGSAILEVGEVSKESPLQISTVHGQFLVKRDGLHRFDIAGDTTRVAVRQGEIWLAGSEGFKPGTANAGTKIGRGKSAMVRGTVTPELAKVDRDAFDEFDVWSFNRAQTLVAANNSALSQARGFNSLSSGWFFDPFSGGYTFIPRNGMFWSPYGFGFFNSFGNCFTCMNSLFFRGYNSIYGNRGPNGGSGILAPNTPSAPGRVINGSDRMAVRREIEGRQVDLNPMNDASMGAGRGMGMGGGMSRSVGAAAPMILAAPAPSRGMGGGGAVGGGGGAAPARPSRN